MRTVNATKRVETDILGLRLLFQAIAITYSAYEYLRDQDDQKW